MVNKFDKKLGGLKIGHIFHKCHDNEEWESHPKKGLLYQADLRNEDYYSIYTHAEMKKLLKHVRTTGEFDIEHLFHLSDVHDWLDELFEANLVDRWDNLEFLAEIHHGFFSNPCISRILCLGLLEKSTVDDVINVLIDRHNDDDEEYFLAFRYFMEKLAKEKFKDKLESKLPPKSEKYLQRFRNK